MHFSKTSGYAIHALTNIGGVDNQARFVRDIARDTGIKKPYLAKVINQLVHCGFLVAKRGYRGGVALARPPEQIFLLQVVQAVEGEAWRHACLFGMEACPGFNCCPAHAAWKDMQDRIERLLGTSTLAELIKATRVLKLSVGGARKLHGAEVAWPSPPPRSPDVNLPDLDASRELGRGASIHRAAPAQAR